MFNLRHRTEKKTSEETENPKNIDCAVNRGTCASKKRKTICLVKPDKKNTEPCKLENL
jgi:hypothetical protein